MNVWVTRAEPGATATAAALRARGHDPLVAPLLFVEPIEDVRLDLEGVHALAFTSANAVRAFAVLTRRRDLPVYAVGRATAATAQAVGLVVHDVGEGGGAALAARIAHRLAPAAGSLLHPTSEEPAGDVAGGLIRRGLAARTVAIYRTRVAEALPDGVAAALEAASLGAVLLHSPRAAGAAARLLRGEPVDRAGRLSAFALSPACLAPLAELPLCRRVAAARPEEAALLDLLGGTG